MLKSTNVKWVDFQSRPERSRRIGQTSVIAWLTGLSGAGKSSIADETERALTKSGRHCMILDGDNLRHGLNRDLGFSACDRDENIRRVAEAARLIADAGLIAIVSVISPREEHRRDARRIAGDVTFVEVFIDTPIEVCADRDPKGLYIQAKNGVVQNFTGISSTYEPPNNPDVILKTHNLSVKTAALPLIDKLYNLSRPNY